jgi:hypothetical protein
METYEKHEIISELRKPIAAEEMAKVAIDWRAIVAAMEEGGEGRTTGESPSYDAISQNALVIREADRKRQDAYNWQQQHPLPQGEV